MILFVRVGQCHHLRELAHCPSSLGQFRLHVGKSSFELGSSDVEIALPFRSAALRSLNVAVTKARMEMVRNGGRDRSNRHTDDEQKFHFCQSNCRQVP